MIRLFFILVTPIAASLVALFNFSNCLQMATFLIFLNCFLSIWLWRDFNFSFNSVESFGKFHVNNFDAILLKQWVTNINWLNGPLDMIRQNTLCCSNWIKSSNFIVEWSFSLNSLNVTMLIVVNLISAIVHLYSLDYMSHDKQINKFFSYISLFTFFMLMLIMGDNLIILFLGWEGVGLCSYLLISFWNTRIQANKAAIKALVVNRIADLALTIGIIITFYVFQTTTFDVIFNLVDFYSHKTIQIFGLWDLNIINIISILLFIGAMGKSAQIGLHTWLPDAMEGPTPVSALIHAATMVTAGVFLIIRCSPIFELAPTTLIFVTCIGAMTAFIAATVGLVQNDIKKVIAYSTCSQLGYMIFACGLSNYSVAFFHLVNHAFFKALLFLSAGAIIHSLSNEQDMRKYGNLLKLLPFTATMLIIGSVALMGFPFFTGFYSKDLILEIAFSKYTVFGSISYVLGVLAAFCTSFYSYRIFYLTFLFNSNTSNKNVIQHVHELPIFMKISLILLSIGSIFFGFLAKDLFVGLGSDFFYNSIVVLPQNNNQVDAEMLPQIVKIFPFFISLVAVIIFNVLYSKQVLCTDVSIGNLKATVVYKFLIYKWYFDLIYNKAVNIPLLRFAYSTIYKVLDKGVFEFFGPMGFSKLFVFTSQEIKKIQTGYVNEYVYVMLLTTLSIIFFI